MRKKSGGLRIAANTVCQPKKERRSKDRMQKKSGFRIAAKPQGCNEKRYVYRKKKDEAKTECEKRAALKKSQHRYVYRKKKDEAKTECKRKAALKEPPNHKGATNKSEGRSSRHTTRVAGNGTAK